MPQQHPPDKLRVLHKIAAQALTINPASAIDRDLTLNWYGETIEPHLYVRKDFESGWVKTYRNGEFYVKDEKEEDVLYGGPQPASHNVFELLKGREIDLEWADFKSSMKASNLEVGTLSDAQYVSRSGYFLHEILFQEKNEWFTLSKDGTITPVPEAELQLWLFGYRGGMSLVTVEKVRELKIHEYPEEVLDAESADMDEALSLHKEETLIDSPVRFSQSGAAES